MTIGILLRLQCFVARLTDNTVGPRQHTCMVHVCTHVHMYRRRMERTCLHPLISSDGVSCWQDRAETHLLPCSPSLACFLWVINAGPLLWKKALGGAATKRVVVIFAFLGRRRPRAHFGMTGCATSSQAVQSVARQQDSRPVGFA